MPGILYIVATPIGNLDDMTQRAVRVLKEVDFIAAEDTRHTRTLLNHYDIHTSLTSYHEHNEKTKAHSLVERLLHGESIALVSDAGTPAISDPGYRLVSAAVQAGIQVSPIPGPSALIAALSASGLPTDRFIFEGFLPAKKGERRDRLQRLRGEARTLIFYEAPHRLPDSLRDLREILGDRKMVLAREVSKVYEEFLRGTVSELLDEIAGREVRGELTLVIQGSLGDAAPSENFLKAEIRRLKGDGMRVKEIAELLGERYGYSKKEIYRLALASDKPTTP